MRSVIEKLSVVGVYLAAGLVVCVPMLRADDAPTNDVERIEKAEERIDKLEKENQALRDSLDKIQAQQAAEAPAPAAVATGIVEKTLGFLDQTAIGGYVTTSYFYDFHKPPEGGSTLNGLTFTRYQNSFTLNAVSLQLQKPVKPSGEDWDTATALICSGARMHP